MAEKKRKPGTIYLRKLEPYEDFIRFMEAFREVPAQNLGRALIAAADKHWRASGGKFDFPIRIECLKAEELPKAPPPPYGLTSAEFRLLNPEKLAEAKKQWEMNEAHRETELSKDVIEEARNALKGENKGQKGYPPGKRKRASGGAAQE